MHIHVSRIVLFVLPSIRTQRVLTLSFSVKSCCSYLAFTFSVDCAARCDASAQACCLAVLPCLACRPFFSVQLSATTLSLSRVLQVCSRCMISCRHYRLRCAKLGQFKRWPMLMQDRLDDVHTTAWRSSHVPSQSNCLYIGLNLMSSVVYMTLF